MKKVAVILSGCGVYDGAEIHESVLTLLCLAQQGAEVTCFAPDKPQMHVVNHLTGEVAEGESRNALIEAARITRGAVKPVTECAADAFDALIVPGGFGAAKNLCDFAVKGAEMTVDEEVLSVCQAFAEQGKAAGYMCIAPAIAAKVYGNNSKVTIGQDPDTGAAITALGAEHEGCDVDQVVIDGDAKLVTTPAYMLAESITQAHQGIEKLVKAVLALA